MRSWPARLIASAHCAASSTERETSPSRRLACMAAPRSRPKASSSPMPRADISRPLARSTHLRSSRRVRSAPSSLRRAASRCQRAPARASSAASGRIALKPSIGAQACTPSATSCAWAASSSGARTRLSGTGRRADQAAQRLEHDPASAPAPDQDLPGARGAATAHQSRAGSHARRRGIGAGHARCRAPRAASIGFGEAGQREMGSRQLSGCRGTA